MFSNQATELSLETPCRALSALRGDHVDARFLIGSCSVQEPNHLFVVRYHSEVNELGLDATISHEDGPVQTICCSPTDSSIVITSAERSQTASLWKLPASIPDQSIGDDAGDDPSDTNMDRLATLSTDGGSYLTDIVWRNSADDIDVSTGDVLTLDDKGRLSRWDVSQNDATLIHSVSTSDKSTNENVGADFPPRVAWDPHGNGNAAAVTDRTAIRILDWRVDTSVPTGTVESFQAHRTAVTNLDYNPNKPYVLSTCGQDGLLKFWDLRSANHPLLVARGGHSHWAWNVQYNPFHDQLVLSTGTDSLVNLWRVSTISSAPLLTLDEDNDDGGTSDTSAPNVRVERYDHGDSVYGAAWGASDAWLYMTLGYDGKAVLNHVPSKEKYKILL